MSAAVTVNGRMASADQTAFLSAMKTYLNSMNSALVTAFPLTAFTPAVRSTKTHTTPHIVRMQCGDVLDTQRRRRDHLPEVYASITMP
jgi:hypothetical protein